MGQERNQDKWVKNDMMFICDGKGYCVTPSGATVCVGSVDDNGNPVDKNQLLPEGVVNDATIHPSDTTSDVAPVTKHTDNKNYAGDIVTDKITDPVTLKIINLTSAGKSVRDISEILKKEGIFISHMTVARRLQGVLPL